MSSSYIKSLIINKLDHVIIFINFKAYLIIIYKANKLFIIIIAIMFILKSCGLMALFYKWCV